jgi:hypothetical protein
VGCCRCQLLCSKKKNQWVVQHERYIWISDWLVTKVDSFQLESHQLIRNEIRLFLQCRKGTFSTGCV